MFTEVIFWVSLWEVHALVPVGVSRISAESKVLPASPAEYPHRAPKLACSEGLAEDETHGDPKCHSVSCHRMCHLCMSWNLHLSSFFPSGKALLCLVSVLSVRVAQVCQPRSSLPSRKPSWRSLGRSCIVSACCPCLAMLQKCEQFPAKKRKMCHKLSQHVCSLFHPTSLGDREKLEKWKCCQRIPRIAVPSNGNSEGHLGCFQQVFYLPRNLILPYYSNMFHRNYLSDLVESSCRDLCLWHSTSSAALSWVLRSGICRWNPHEAGF